MYWGFGTLDYLVGEPYGNNIEADIVTPDFLAGLAQTEQEFVFVVMQERWDDYVTILEVFPDGEEEKIYSGDGRLLGVLYRP